MKKGITMISIIIYIVLFTVFSAFVISLSSNLNRNVLESKAESFIQNEYSKLYVNMIKSAKESKYYSNDTNKIVFSNGDVYFFNLEDHNIYKNGGILASDLKEFSLKQLTQISGISMPQSVLELSKSLCMNITFFKYGTELSRDLVVSVGDGIN